MIISLRANRVANAAHQLNLEVKADFDRNLLTEKNAELLTELDTQHVKLERLKFILLLEIACFDECPSLHKFLPEELERLKNNLDMVEVFLSQYQAERELVESPQSEENHPVISRKLADVRRLTIHFIKDIEQESDLLAQLKNLVKTAPKK